MKVIKGCLLLCVSVCILTGCGQKNSTEVTEVTTTSVSTEVTTKEVTTESTTEITTEEATETKNPREDILISIDPGHQAPSVDMSASEPNAPGSSEMKRKATGGTQGRYTGVAEYELNLNISKKLRDALQAEGYQVIMTREDNETAISNSERAILANESHADVAIRIHANGSDDEQTNGALAMVGSADNPYVGSLYEDSNRLAQSILDAYCENTGMKNLGVQTTDTMTGINWSQIPVMILEMGFMTNQQDDENMEDETYQEKMVSGIVQGVDAYFSLESVAEKTENDTVLGELQEQLENDVTAFVSTGGKACIYVEDLLSGKTAQVGSGQQRAASMIKLYVAGCIYEEQRDEPETALQDVDDLIQKMLSQSDNDATNTLVEKLGGGDAQAGMSKVNAFCERHGLADSSMERLMLDFSSGKENYTSVQDSAAFLRSLYYGKLAGSDKMLAYLKQQERVSKIPAGVPEGVVTANKTGELDGTENDVAIVYAENHPYVISVMTDDLSDTAAARQWIVRISSEVYDYLTTEE
jgi:N-acetylmuramoyl-L-alanine amidase